MCQIHPNTHIPRCSATNDHMSISCATCSWAQTEPSLTKPWIPNETARACFIATKGSPSRSSTEDSSESQRTHLFNNVGKHELKYLNGGLEIRSSRLVGESDRQKLSQVRVQYGTSTGFSVAKHLRMATCVLLATMGLKPNWCFCQGTCSASPLWCPKCLLQPDSKKGSRNRTNLPRAKCLR